MTTKLIENYTQRDLKEYCLYDTIDFDSFSTKEWVYFISLINDSKTEKTMKEYYQTSAIDYIYITKIHFKRNLENYRYFTNHHINNKTNI